MPGGLVQLTGFGARNVFLNGNPSNDVFYEDVQAPHELCDGALSPPSDERYRYESPDCRNQRRSASRFLGTPISSTTVTSALTFPISGRRSLTFKAQINIAKEFQFQWIRNLGYNMIQQATVTLNGSPVVTMTGEWMKIASYLKHDATKRAIHR